MAVVSKTGLHSDDRNPEHAQEAVYSDRPAVRELSGEFEFEEIRTAYSANAQAPKRLHDLLSSGGELPEELTRGVLA